jgi:hypothetical protein
VATPEEEPDPLPRALEVIGTIVAPTTLLTALLFYFGLLYSVGYYRFFGVNFTVLDLPAQGFLTLSASTAVLPLALAAAATLLALALRRLPLHRLPGRVEDGVTVGVAVIGAVLVGLAAADALLGVAVFPATFWEARGLSLTVGVLLLVWADDQRHPRRRPHGVTVVRWCAVFVLVGIGLFWAVGSYAIRVGADGARGLAADLRCGTDVVLYSEQSLNLATAGVREERGPDGAYAFRYPGFKLVPQSGDQYLLVPADWAPGARPAVVLPRSDTLRLEFVTRASCR